MREGFHYFCEKHLELEDIARCTEAAGYQTYINYADFELFVSFIFHHEGKNLETYFSWSKILTDVSQLEEKDQAEILSVNLHPKTLLSGEYMKITLPNVIPILKTVMQCYGGYYHLEFGFYGAENLDKALDDAVAYGFLDFDSTQDA